MPASHPVPSPSSFSAALHASRPSPAAVRSPWLRLAIGVALLAIAVQLLAMAQLAHSQVQRGAQMRQALVAKQGQNTEQARPELVLRTASATRPGAPDDLPAYVLR